MSWVPWRVAEKLKMDIWGAVRGRQSAVRGRQFGPWARSAVVNLGLERGPRSLSWAGARSAVVGMGQKRGLAVKHNP